MGRAVPVERADIHGIATVLVSIQQRRKRERCHYRERVRWGECSADSLNSGKATSKTLAGYLPVTVLPPSGSPPLSTPKGRGGPFILFAPSEAAYVYYCTLVAPLSEGE
jgi:hypothetical protein